MRVALKCGRHFVPGGHSSMSTSLVRGGTIITCEGRFRADVLCRDGKIVEIAEGVEAPEASELIDAGGCYVMPGGIDPHTHMQLPMMGTIAADDFFTGTAAAAAGGTTTILDFVGPERDQSPLEALSIWRARAAKAAVDYGFHMTVSWWGEAFSQAMATLVGEHGVSSFKFFLAYKGRLMLADAELIAGFQRCRELGALVQVHAENGELIDYLQKKIVAEGETAPLGHALSRPAQCEAEATLRAITMAEIVGVPLYVVHVSAAEAANAIGSARERGVNVVGETLPGFLAIDESVYRNADFDVAAGHVMSPPYRAKRHQEALWRAIGAGALGTTGTDHCCFTKAQKRLGLGDFTKIPNGCGGVEDRLHVLWHLGVNGGRLTPERFVALTSANAAKVFNLWPRKGSLQVGADADLIVLDPERDKTISAASQHQCTDFSVWEGLQIKGVVVHTLVRGYHAWADGDLRARAGWGRYLARPAFGNVYRSGVSMRTAN
jgi:dihydropyrimidinase